MSQNILDLLQEQLSGDALQQLSQQIGAKPEQTQTAIQSALPAMLQALSKNAATEKGATSLANSLDKDHDGSILNDLMGFINSGNDTNGGSDILQNLFGNKRPAVEGTISQQTGLNKEATSNLMTQLAPLVMGFLGQQKKQSGLDVGGLADLVMNQFSGAKQKSSGNSALDMISGLLDQDKDGDMTDDLLDMGKGLLGNLFGGKK